MHLNRKAETKPLVKVLLVFDNDDLVAASGLLRTLFQSFKHKQLLPCTR